MNPHSITTRVYFEDTDAGGVVYHTAYLRFMERGRTEWLRAHGWSLAQVRELGVVLVVRKIEVDFLSAATLEDNVEIVTRHTHHSRARVFFEQSVLLRPPTTTPLPSATDQTTSPSLAQPATTPASNKTILCRAVVCCACKQLDHPKASPVPEPLARVFGSSLN